MTTSYESLRAAFAAEPTTTRPMMRWWWFGPEVDDAEVVRELEAMKAGGIGGVEVSHVYPLNEVSTGFLSPRHLASLRVAAETAQGLGLRFALTLGTGWSFGGPHITPDLASRGLVWVRREITPGPLAVPATAPYPGDELVAAFLGAGSIQESPRTYEPLPVVDGAVQVPEGRGPRTVLLAYSRLTGQNVKRAAFDAEGPVLDHYSRAAAEAHLAAVGDVLLDAVPAELVDSVFCDSLEVYDADWTGDLPAEFERRRGYDLLPRLWQVHVDSDTSTELRADFFRTLTELYEERFAAVMQQWAARRGVRFRIQGYGQPPASISSYRFADLVEGEGWGWTDLTQARWATSAAHLYGHQVCSSETWTWNHSPSFRTTPLDLQGEAHDHLLQGVNQFIGHGWPYTAPDAEGVGFMFYASGAYDDRNPWYGPAMLALTTYLGRLCAVMQQGDPVADVTILIPSQDAAATMPGSIDLWREVRAYVGDDLTAAIRTNGWDFDLVDDLVVEAPDRERRVILVPGATLMPDRTREWLEEQHAAGSHVLLIDSSVDVAGARRVTRAGLVDALREVCPPDALVAPPSHDIGVTHRSVDGAEVYLVANTSQHRREFTLTPRDRAEVIEVWDAHDGSVVRTQSGPSIDLTLAPYEAAVLVTGSQTTLRQAQGPDGRSVPEPAEGARIGSDGLVAEPESWRPVSGPEPVEGPQLGPWTVSVAGETPAPITVPHRWEHTPGLERFCGSVTYGSSFHLAHVPDRLVLDLGECPPAPPEDPAEAGMRGRSFRADVLAPVGEVAEVWVNGQRCGVVWAPPYVVDVTAALQAGVNEMQVVVSSTLAHAVADDPHITERADAVTTLYGQRFAMQELHLADSGVRSGLLAVPVLRF